MHRKYFALSMKAFVVCALMIVSGIGSAQVPKDSADSETPEPVSPGDLQVPKHPVVKMKLRPAAAPVPAMKYALLPEVRDLKPGNAALLYQRAHAPEWTRAYFNSNQQLKNDAYMEMPLGKLQRDKILLPSGPLKELDLAARRENCDWEMTPRLRAEGYNLLVPDIQAMREYAQVLALRSRLDIQDGKFDQAIYGLQTGFAMSRHVNENPFLISSLVGMAIGQTMLDRVEEVMQMENAPNLYWSLADLPRPFIDLRRPWQGEKLVIDSLLPEIRAALNDPKLPAVDTQKLQTFVKMNWGQLAGIDRMSLAFFVARAYPAAGKYLLANGYSVDQVKALPVTQVSLMYTLALCDQSFDNLYRWQNFPFWQAWRRIGKEEVILRNRMNKDWEAMTLARAIVPGTAKVLLSQARLDRHIAILQLIEAIRLHADAEGKLPEALEDIRIVPIPLDPMTGKNFDYECVGNTVVLNAPPPPNVDSVHNSLRYELTFTLPK